MPFVNFAVILDPQINPTPAVSSQGIWYGNGCRTRRKLGRVENMADIPWEAELLNLLFVSDINEFE